MWNVQVHGQGISIGCLPDVGLSERESEREGVSSDREREEGCVLLLINFCG